MKNKPRKNTAKKPLGEALVEAGLIDSHQLAVALGQQQRWGGKLGSELVRLGFIEERELAFVLQEQLGIKWISLHNRDIPQQAIKKISPEVAKKFLVMPVDLSGNVLTLATINPTDLATLDNISFAAGIKIRPVMALESEIKRAISRHYEAPFREIKKLHSEAELLISPIQLKKTDLSAAPLTSKKNIGSFAEKLSMRSPKAQEAMIKLLIKKGVFTKEEFMIALQGLD